MNKTKCPKGHYYDADMFSECPHCKKTADPKTEAIFHRLQEEPRDKPWRVSEPPAEQEEKTVALQAHEASGSSEERTVGFFEHRHSMSETPVNEKKTTTREKGNAMASGTSASEPKADSEKTQMFWSSSSLVQEESKHEEAEPVANEELPKQASDPIVGWIVCIKGKRYGECFTIGAGKNSIGRGDDNRIHIAGDVQVSRSQHAYIIYEPRSRKFYLQPGNSSGLTYLNQQLVLMPELLKERDEIGLNESRFLFIPLCNESFSWEMSV